MSNTLTLNAILALIEERPEAARAFLRSPHIPVQDIGPIQARLQAALERVRCKAVREAVREVVRKTLTISVPTDMAQAQRDAFLQGIIAVEDILEQVIITCNQTEGKSSE